MAQNGSIIQLAVVLLRIGIGLLFLWAGAIKAWSPHVFLLDVQGYQLLSYKLAVAASIYLPWLEMVCGLALVVGRVGCRGATLILGVLMSLFTLALAAGWYRGLDITCGCFGSGDGQTHYGFWMARDLGLVGAIVLLWLGDRCNRSVRGGPTATNEPSCFC